MRYWRIVLTRSYLRWCLLALAAALGSCTHGTYVAPPNLADIESTRKISDADIQAAITAKPGLKKPLVIALYGANGDLRGFADSLRQLPGVSKVVDVAPALVEGDSYFYRSDQAPYEYTEVAPTTTLLDYRLAAARMHADMLLYFGTSCVTNTHANILVWTYALYVPLFFAPARDADLRTEVEMYCVDVRTGYFYGTYHEEDFVTKETVTEAQANLIDKFEFKSERAAAIVPALTLDVSRILSESTFFPPEGR